MSLPYKLIVFDWDGTVIDSNKRIIHCFQVAIEELGLAARDDEQIRSIIGLSMSAAMYHLYDNKINDELIDTFVQHYRAHYFSNLPIPTPLFPEVSETLEQLEEAGYWLAVATGKGTIGLQKSIQDSGLTGRFHSTRTAEQTRSKPHPQMLHEIMVECDKTPEETLMIGDSTFDLEMANNAKVASIAVTCGAHSVERLQQHAPLTCLQQIRELPHWLATQ